MQFTYLHTRSVLPAHTGSLGYYSAANRQMKNDNILCIEICMRLLYCNDPNRHTHSKRANQMPHRRCFIHLDSGAGLAGHRYFSSHFACLFNLAIKADSAEWSSAGWQASRRTPTASAPEFAWKRPIVSQRSTLKHATRTTRNIGDRQEIHENNK